MTWIGVRTFGIFSFITLARGEQLVELGLTTHTAQGSLRELRRGELVALEGESKADSVRGCGR
jgi:hypothetical protein